MHRYLPLKFQLGTDHEKEPWNWTGWIPRWQRQQLWDPEEKANRFVNNRFFMGLRANEIQNNMWDYHPMDDVYNHDNHPVNVVPEYDAVGNQFKNTMYEFSGGQNDKYRGGYFFEGNSWGRYTHINALKSHVKDHKTGDFKR